MPQEELRSRVIRARNIVERKVGVAPEVPKVKRKRQMRPSPPVVKHRREQEQNQQGEIEDGKDAEAATDVKTQEKVRVRARVKQNPGNQKSGERKKQVNADPPAHPKLVQRVQDAAAMRAAAEVMKKDHQDREGADAVERRKAGLEVDRAKRSLGRSQSENSPRGSARPYQSSGAASPASSDYRTQPRS